MVRLARVGTSFNTGDLPFESNHWHVYKSVT